MTPALLLPTALLLGGFVLAAGCYGALYAISRLSGRRGYAVAAGASYAVQCAIALAVLALCPLGVQWKVLVACSTAAYLVIPPITWHYLDVLHRSPEAR